LAQTLFDGGKRRAVTEQSWAIYQGSLANYRQTALSAFQDVEDRLSTLRILSQEFQTGRCIELLAALPYAGQCPL
jgi:outer membrane protein TolC